MDMPTKVFFGALAAAGLAVLTTLGAAKADEYDALRNDARIENGVLIVAIGDVIRDNCPTIEDRRSRSIPVPWSGSCRARNLWVTAGPKLRPMSTIRPNAPGLRGWHNAG